MLDCFSAGKSDDPISLKDVKAWSGTEHTHSAEHSAGEKHPAALKEAQNCS